MSNIYKYIYIYIHIYVYICYDDDVLCYINLMLDKQDSMYYFIQFVYQKKTYVI